MDSGFPFLIVLFIIAAIAIGVIGWWMEKKRREALAALAASLGLSYSHNKDRALAHEMSFLEKSQQGSNRYAYNILRGTYAGEEILAFDYHYETHSSDSKGRRKTHHHYLSYVTLTLPRAFPELTIAPEGFFSKIAQAVGYDDIDFESAEFSRKYVVRAADRKFAYDFCHARTIEFLLDQPVEHLEVEHHILAACQKGKFKVEEIPGRLDHLIELRRLMPDYLFTQT